MALKPISREVANGEELYSKLLNPDSGVKPKDLTCMERRLVVLYMMSKNLVKGDLTVGDIQKVFQVAQNTAYHDLNYCRTKIAEYAGVKDVMDFVNAYISRKQSDRQRALQEGNVGLATEIDDNLFDRLCRIGLLGNAKEPHPIHAQEINVTNISTLNERELQERLNQAIARAREYQQLEAGDSSPQ